MIDASKRGLPAIERLLEDDLPPLLEQHQPAFRNLNSILQVIADYRHEITALPRQHDRGDAGGDEPPGRLVAPLPAHPDHAQPGDGRRLSAALRSTAPTRTWSRSATTRSPPTCRSSTRRTARTAARRSSIRPTRTIPTCRTASAGKPVLRALPEVRLRRPALLRRRADQPPCTKQGPFQSIGEPPREQTDYQHVRPSRRRPAASDLTGVE